MKIEEPLISMSQYSNLTYLSLQGCEILDRIDLSVVWLTLCQLEKLHLIMMKHQKAIFSSQKIVVPHPKLKELRITSINNNDVLKDFTRVLIPKLFMSGNRLETFELSIKKLEMEEDFDPFDVDLLPKLDFSSLKCLMLSQCNFKLARLRQIADNITCLALQKFYLHNVHIIVDNDAELHQKTQFNVIVEVLTNAKFAATLENLQLKEMNMSTITQPCQKLAESLPNLQLLDLSSNPWTAQSLINLFSVSFSSLAQADLSTETLKLEELILLFYTCASTFKKLRAVRCEYDIVAPRGNVDSTSLNWFFDTFSKALIKQLEY